MKRTLLAFCFASLLATTLAQPRITFDEKEHDFGTFEEETGRVTHVFRFVNSGNEPLVVTNVRTTCGCTASQYTREPVAPNDSGVIKVTYNPKGRPGRFSKPVYVTTNASTDRETLRITGVVIGSKSRRAANPYRIGDLSLRSLHMPLFDVPKGHLKTGQLFVRNEGKSDLIPIFKQVPSHITVEMIPAILHPDEEGIIKISYDPDAIDDWGFRRDEFKLGFESDTESTFNTITVSANLLDDFGSWTAEERQQAGHATLSTEVVDFGIIKGNKPQKQTLTITNNGESKLTIHKVTNENRPLQVKLKRHTINPGKSAELTVEVDPSLARTNLLNCRVMLITDDPNRPSVPIRVLGSFE
ncbi:DUF1573 domain-containing protein [Barnesiella sp. An22]|uniref:DUF1573 domain-containing protein n=1 Tax=Barnesiella sp. An22 TaxID=1965590 RepID=UPI000B384726|nr:DUF1573 domain-containing protein [Barnesiella sp. An22]OUO97669.1 hypothetical protein B5F38_09195 [Barnesiella sp. An22]